MANARQLTVDDPCHEIRPGRQWQGIGVDATHCRSYWVWSDDTSIMDIVKAKTPGLVIHPCTLIGLVKKDIVSINETMTKIDPDGVKRGKYRVEICWSHPDAVTGGEDEKVPGELLSVNFGSQGRRINVATSRETWCYQGVGEIGNTTVNENYYPLGTPIIDEKCNIIGCPATSVTTKFCESYCVAKELVSKEYCRAIDLSIGTLNSLYYRGCEPCELMLTGVTANRNSIDSDWTFQFCFEKSQNRLIWYRFLVGFASPAGMPADPCAEPQFADALIPVGGFDHVDPWTHVFKCKKRSSPNYGKRVSLRRLYRYNPHLKTDFEFNLGI